MITLEKAKIIAQEQMSEYSIAEIIDIGDQWAFCFDTGENPVPGVPVITVSKKDGLTNILPIPPLENLEVLNKGKTIWEK